MSLHESNTDTTAFACQCTSTAPAPSDRWTIDRNGIEWTPAPIDSPDGLSWQDAMEKTSRHYLDLANQMLTAVPLDWGYGPDAPPVSQGQWTAEVRAGVVNLQPNLAQEERKWLPSGLFFPAMAGWDGHPPQGTACSLDPSQEALGW